MTTTAAAPLTRREAREIERRTGVRPIAGATAPAAAPAFRHDTGEIARNELGSLVSVLPTALVTQLASAPERPASATTDSAVDRGLTFRAAMPAALVAARRRRVVGGVAAVASVGALATAGLVSAGADAEQVADAHRADLLAPLSPAQDPAPAPVEPAQAPDAPHAPAPQVEVAEGASSVVSIDSGALLGAVGERVSEPEQVEAASGSAAARPAAAADASVLAIAEQYLGVPYVLGGTTPAGFDCSGYVAYVLNQAGYNAPVSISGLAALGTVTDSPQPGDLVVYGNSHIGFYAGPGSLLHAPYEGDVVRYGNMDWGSHYFVRLG